MKFRWISRIVAALLMCVLLGSPAYAQKKKGPEGPKQEEPAKPVGQYILVVILLSIPFGLICRSSRRM